MVVIYETQRVAVSDRSPHPAAFAVRLNSASVSYQELLKLSSEIQVSVRVLMDEQAEL